MSTGEIEMTDHANELRRYSRKIGHPAGDVPSVMLATADEIERLAARLEAAEKELAELRSSMKFRTSLIGRTEAERDVLRAKVERMEQQEPVLWQVRTRPTWNATGWSEWRDCCEEHAKDVTKAPMLHDWLYEARALYALPGAQPAPSVPTSLVVAIADLVTQMEIVSRVGFVDTPNDKDSCAASCVAEGTWLELMSAIESLAAALAAAPEAKP